MEPPLSYLWDAVPFEGYDFAAWRHEFTAEIQKVRNSFWYVHHEKHAQVRLLETDPYHIQAAAGQFDIGLLASVLLHCRRPFDLLESVARRTERTMIITEVWNPTLGDGPVCMLLPHQGMKQVHTWWHFTPQTGDITSVFATLHVENRWAPAWLVRRLVWPFLKRVNDQDARMLAIQSANMQRFPGVRGASTQLDLVRPWVEAFWQTGEAPADQQAREVRILL